MCFPPSVQVLPVVRKRAQRRTALTMNLKWLVVCESAIFSLFAFVTVFLSKFNSYFEVEMELCLVAVLCFLQPFCLGIEYFWLQYLNRRRQENTKRAASIRHNYGTFKRRREFRSFRVANRIPNRERFSLSGSSSRFGFYQAPDLPVHSRSGRLRSGADCALELSNRPCQHFPRNARPTVYGRAGPGERLPG